MRRPVLAILMAVLAVACGGAVGARATTSAPTPSPTASPTSQVVKVTEADNKGTVTAHVGDRIQIALGDQWDWKLEPPDGVVLARQMPQTYLLVRGTQAIWIARSVGSATIHATGTYPCPSGKVCIQIATAFTATVNVLP